MSAACDRLPPGGLFAPGSVDEVVSAARRLDYLQHATGNTSGGSPLNAIAQLAREEQELGYVNTGRCIRAERLGRDLHEALDLRRHQRLP